MKPVIPLCAAIFLLVSTLGMQAETYYKVTNLTGTVAIQHTINADEARIITKPLDAKRIFAEFAVSPQDYVLVYSSSGLILLPRQGAASLPVYTVVKPSVLKKIIDTKARVIRASGGIDTGNPNPNLFKSLAGTIVTKTTYSGVYSESTVKKLVITVLGNGTDQNQSTTGLAFLKFRFTCVGTFVQPN